MLKKSYTSPVSEKFKLLYDHPSDKTKPVNASNIWRHHLTAEKNIPKDEAEYIYKMYVIEYETIETEKPSLN